MKKTIIIFLLLSVAGRYLHAIDLESLFIHSKKIGYYAYQLNNLNTYPPLCPNGCKLTEKDVENFFNKNKDKYKLVQIWTLRGYVDRFSYIVIKEEEEYKSSGIADKSIIFQNAKTPSEWIALRRQYSDFRIRNGLSEEEIVKSLRNANYPLRDFMDIFTEYKDDKDFQKGALNVTSNKKELVEYIDVFGDKQTAKTFTLNNGLLRMEVKEFIEIFNDKESVKSFVLAQSNLYGLGVREFIEIFNDKESIKQFVLKKSTLFGLSFREFLDIFNDKNALENWIFTYLPKSKTTEICESLGNQVVEKYFNKFEVLPEDELIEYLQCTNNFTKATAMTCFRLADLSKSEPTSNWFIRLISPVSGVFILEGHINCKLNGISYANKIIPFIKDNQSVMKIEKAITTAYNDVDKYRKQIEEIRENYRRSEREYKREMCAKCEIDLENENNKLLPESRHYDDFFDELFFSYDNPGIWYMKNGESYKFYQNSNGKWNVSTGWGTSENFDKYIDMLSHFIKECQEKYCR